MLDNLHKGRPQNIVYIYLGVGDYININMFFRLLGLHLNMVIATGKIGHAKVFLGSVLPSGWIMDPKLEKFWYPLSTFYGNIIREMGYLHIQATKPDTVGKTSFGDMLWTHVRSCNVLTPIIAIIAILLLYNSNITVKYNNALI